MTVIIPHRYEHTQNMSFWKSACIQIPSWKSLHCILITNSPKIILMLPLKIGQCRLIQWLGPEHAIHHYYYNNDKMNKMASQNTGVSIVCSTICSGTDQRKHQSSSASLAFVRGSHRWPVNCQHNGPVTRKMFPFDPVMTRFICA